MDKNNIFLIELLVESLLLLKLISWKSYIFQLWFKLDKCFHKHKSFLFVISLLALVNIVHFSQLQFFNFICFGRTLDAQLHAI